MSSILHFVSFTKDSRKLALGSLGQAKRSSHTKLREKEGSEERRIGGRDGGGKERGG